MFRLSEQEALDRQSREMQLYSVAENHPLYDAVKYKNHDKLIDLLSSVNLTRDKYFAQSLFDLAVIKGDVISVELLLVHGIQPNLNRENESWPQSPLAQAIKNQDDKIIRLLVNCGCDPDSILYINEDSDEKIIMSPIPLNYWYKTIEQNNLPAFQCLLECTDRKIGKNEWSQNILLTACGLGSIEITEYLLNKGMNVETTDANGWTCLFHAAINRRMNIIQMLVGRDANINHKDSENRNILHVLVYYDMANSVSTSTEEIFDLLIYYGAKIDTINVNDKWNQLTFIMACRLGSSMIIKYFLKKGVSFESVDKNGWTGLFHAVKNKHLSVIQQLVARGANLIHKDSLEQSILHIAVLDQTNSEHSVEIIKFLIESGADINTTNNDGLTPINAALNEQNVNVDIIKEFLRHQNIDLAKPDAYGITVLHRAISADLKDTDNYDLVKEILTKPDVDVNARDQMKRTPLDYMRTTDGRIITLFLYFGLDAKILYHFSESNFSYMLKDYKLKRIAADLSVDLNIDNMLKQYPVRDPTVYRFNEDYYEYSYKYEIERMKKTLLCDNITFYDFLHAKKFMLINIAKRPGMRKMFLKGRHGFEYYKDMLTKNYVDGLRAFTEIELKAMNSIEDNLNVIFNGKLPSLVLHHVKKYLELEDMITIDNMKLFRLIED